MSAHSPASDSHDESPWRRDNWFGRQQRQTETMPDKPDPNDPNRHIAFQLLRDTAVMLCRTSLRDDPWNGGHLAEAIALVLDDDPDHDGRASVMHTSQTATELSDPKHRPPTETVNAQRYRVRVNDETGYLTGLEGTTGVVIADRPLAEFISVVNLWLEGRRTDMLDREKEQARQMALSLKTDQADNGLSDLEILTKVVRSVRE